MLGCTPHTKTRKTNSCKYRSGNCFFPSFSSGNLASISTDILKANDYYVVVQQRPAHIVALYLTSLHIPNAFTCVAEYSAVSAVEQCQSCVLLVCSPKRYKNLLQYIVGNSTFLYRVIVNTAIWMGIRLMNWQTCNLCTAVQMAGAGQLRASIRKRSYNNAIQTIEDLPH